MMEWPGPQTEQTQTWEITADRDSWKPWKDRRVLPPVWAEVFGERFASKGEPQPPMQPMQPEQVFDWAAEGDAVDEEIVVEQGEPIDDLSDYWNKAIQGKPSIPKTPPPSEVAEPSVDIDVILKGIPSWTEKQLAQQLGKDKNKTLKSFADNEQQLLESLRIHQALLLEWENNADKNKKKAAKTYQELIGRHDQA
ncbi:hypothetical protein CKO42_08645 [Lamprobacter modestohalophilus]|uniref:Uncharacterized protein n=1 Tax=Lamprobacter modestohalophilus TaxID=1064514 RepID=A0A9X0W7Q6_9GAMM|nr:hypothetical protein [Lamprobacter modestohalophilus]MBK1618505.1 hypothetical protein [Lamprobacter modestohalophilus]